MPVSSAISRRIAAAGEDHRRDGPAADRNLR
jgi:hypothetical protein